MQKNINTYYAHLSRMLGLILISFCWSINANELNLDTANKTPSTNNDAQNLFKHYAPQMVQVQLIELSSGNKTAIGSGFQVNETNLIATNFHVVSNAIHQPEHYKIELITADKTRTSAQLVNFDIINDLALLSTNITHEPLKLAKDEPSQGETVFSIGNPSDYGMIVVPGIYNGLTDKSYYQRIHFTGAINSGMSGGPVLNEQGEIIGVNVATGGNAIGFLVPLSKLNQLINQPRLAKIQQNKSGFASHIEQQLLTSQENKIATIMDHEWLASQLGNSEVFSEISPFVPCWGDSNAADEQAYFFASSVQCSSKEQIFIKPNFFSGRIEVAFTWFESKQLNSSQFYHLIENKFAGARAGNKAQKNDVTNYVCHQDFHQLQASEKISKVVLCTRAYKAYPALFDLLYIAVTVSEEQQALLSHFTLSGVSKASGQAFTKTFMDSILWN